MKKHNKVFKILFMVMVIVLMTGCETIDTVDFNERCVMCGDDTYFPAYLVKLVANIIGFIQVMVPVIIILVGMIELFKAVIASDEKKMSESKDSLIRKIIAGVMIYLVIAVIQFAFTAIPNFTDGDIDVMECVSYFITGPDGSVGCPQRVTGNAVSLKDRDEQANVNIVDPIEKEKSENKEKEYENIKPEYKECHSKSKSECGANGSTDGCQWCDHNPDAPNSTYGVCAVRGECGANYTCYKCTSNGITTYEWNKSASSGCKSMGKVNQNGQKIDQGTCEALRRSEINKAENYACYVCKENGKAVDYVWASKVNGAGTGCYVTNAVDTEDGCKALRANLNN